MHDSPPHSDSVAEQSALLVQNHIVVVGIVVDVVDVVDVVVEVAVVDVVVDRAMHSPSQQLHESPPHSDSVAEQSARLVQNHFSVVIFVVLVVELVGVPCCWVLVVVVVVRRLVVGLCTTGLDGLPLWQREDF